MKRWIHAASTTSNILYVDKIDEDFGYKVFRPHVAAITRHDGTSYTENYGLDYPLKLRFANDVQVMNLDELCDAIGGLDLSNMLYYAKDNLTKSSFNELKKILAEGSDDFNTQLHRSKANEAKQIYTELASKIKSLKIKGLEVSVRPGSIVITYRPDPQKFNLDASEYASNVEELSKCFRSIPAVSKIEDVSWRNQNEDPAWQLIWNINSTDTDINYIPDIQSIPFNNIVSYKVTFVHPVIYMSRKTFQYGEQENNDGIMYMSSSASLTCADSSVQTFSEELYNMCKGSDLESIAEEGLAASTWDELFDIWDSDPYEHNGALLQSCNFIKLVQTEQGKSTTLYSRQKP